MGENTNNSDNNSYLGRKITEWKQSEDIQGFWKNSNFDNNGFIVRLTNQISLVTIATAVRDGITVEYRYS